MCTDVQQQACLTDHTLHANLVTVLLLATRWCAPGYVQPFQGNDSPIKSRPTGKHRCLHSPVAQYSHCTSNHMLRVANQPQEQVFCTRLVNHSHTYIAVAQTFARSDCLLLPQCVECKLPCCFNTIARLLQGHATCQEDAVHPGLHPHKSLTLWLTDYAVCTATLSQPSCIVETDEAHTSMRSYADARHQRAPLRGKRDESIAHGAGVVL
jgi:hypothetical protein